MWAYHLFEDVIHFEKNVLSLFSIKTNLLCLKKISNACLMVPPISKD
jgi:hypothetical protein